MIEFGIIGARLEKLAQGQDGLAVLPAVLIRANVGESSFGALPTGQSAHHDKEGEPSVVGSMQDDAHRGGNWADRRLDAQGDSLRV